MEDSTTSPEPVVTDDASPEALVNPMPPPRVTVRICGREGYVNSSEALTFMLLETATKDMTKEQLADFSTRYMLRVEVYAAPEGEEKWLVCERGRVDW